jgi:alanine dehydrogenase
VAIDQGGCFETSHPTTHQDPTFEVDGIIHYCVANMPGAVPITSTHALTNATLPYAIALADEGVVGAIRRDPGLRPGVNVAAGAVTHPAVAEGVSAPCVPLEEALQEPIADGTQSGGMDRFQSRRPQPVEVDD